MEHGTSPELRSSYGNTMRNPSSNIPPVSFLKIREMAKSRHGLHGEISIYSLYCHLGTISAN